MANEEHLKILRQGVEVWNAWRSENLELWLDLSEIDFRGANLNGANLSGANLRAAQLSEAHLSKAFLSGANLSGANLRAAQLSEAHLSAVNLGGANLRAAQLNGAQLHRANLLAAQLLGANLRAAQLSEAQLNGANLSAANLCGASLSKATFGGTTLGGLDLSKGRGLDSAKHNGPSTVGTDTLRRSQGQIPETFLKGCGLSDWEIEAAKLWNRDMTEEQRTTVTYEILRLQGEQPLALFRLFLSYSHKDAPFLEAIEPGLDAQGIRYWRDVHDMTAGPVERQIDRALTLHPTVVLVLSENSVESDWVEWEAEKARELEKKLRKQGVNRHVLCPLALDSSWEECDWEERLRRQIKKYHVLDFSGWWDESRFRVQMGKLFEGLTRYYGSEEAR